MNGTLTRREQAEAYADLYEVPITDVYRRYGAVLLPVAAVSHQRSAVSAQQEQLTR